MSVRRINPPELLDLADELTGHAAGAGRPRTLWLRRGVSSAYYALFHQVCWDASMTLHPSGAAPGQAEGVSRWIAHADLATLAEAASAEARWPSATRWPLWIPESSPSPTTS